MVRLISQQPVEMAIADSDISGIEPSAHYVDIRDAAGKTLARVKAREAFSTSAEVFPERAGEPITRVDIPTPKGAFTVVLPIADNADHFTLVKVAPSARAPVTGICAYRSRWRQTWQASRLPRENSTQERRRWAMSTSDGSVLGNAQIFGSAPRNRAFNVVMLADGFTAAQQNDFNNACTAFVTAFRATPPFDELEPAINVFRVNVISTDSGADDPGQRGGTGATARTYFDSTFGTNGIRRLLTCNNTTALQVAAAQIPEFTVVIVVVNSTVYGGSGGSVGTYSLAGGATEIAIHEMGHTAFGLADEYPYYAGGNETGHDHHPAGRTGRTQRHHQYQPRHAEMELGGRRRRPRSRRCEPELRNGGQPAQPGADRHRRTLRGRPLLSLRRFRPEYDCKMRNLGVPFCRICRQVIWNRIGPLATLPARTRTPINVVARFPEHLDVFAVASDGRTMSNWWDASSGWAGWFQVSGGIASPGGAGSPVTAIARYAGHLDLFTVGTDNRVYSCWWDQATRLVRLVHHREPRLPVRLDGQCRIAL